MSSESTLIPSGVSKTYLKPVIISSIVLVVLIGAFLLWYFFFRKVQCEGNYGEWSVCQDGKRTKKFNVTKKGENCPIDLVQDCDSKFTTILSQLQKKDPLDYKILGTIPISGTARYNVFFTLNNMRYESIIDVEKEKIEMPPLNTKNAVSFGCEGMWDNGVCDNATGIKKYTFISIDPKCNNLTWSENCVVNCTGTYTDFTPCNLDEKQYKYYKVDISPKNNGMTCPPSQVSVDCNAVNTVTKYYIRSRSGKYIGRLNTGPAAFDSPAISATGANIEWTIGCWIPNLNSGVLFCSPFMLLNAPTYQLGFHDPWCNPLCRNTIEYNAIYGGYTILGSGPRSTWISPTGTLLDEKDYIIDTSFTGPTGTTGPNRVYLAAGVTGPTGMTGVNKVYQVEPNRSFTGPKESPSIADCIFDFIPVSPVDNFCSSETGIINLSEENKSRIKTQFNLLRPNTPLYSINSVTKISNDRYNLNYNNNQTATISMYRDFKCLYNLYNIN